MAHPAQVGLEDLLLPAAHDDALLVRGEGIVHVPDQVIRLAQVEHGARVGRVALMLFQEQRQVHLHTAARSESCPAGLMPKEHAANNVAAGVPGVPCEHQPKAARSPRN